MVFKIVFTTIVVLKVIAAYSTSSEKEMDLVIDMLLKNEVNNTNSVENVNEEKNAGELVYSNGVWKCGKCDDIDESRLVLTETYDLSTNEDKKDFVNFQVGLSLKDIRCVIITGAASELSSVRRVRGNCAGEGASLRVAHAGKYEVKVYE